MELEFWFPVLSGEKQKLMYNIVEEGRGAVFDRLRVAGFLSCFGGQVWMPATQAWLFWEILICSVSGAKCEMGRGYDLRP